MKPNRHFSGRTGREFSNIVKRSLGERVAYMCSNPLCRRLTIRPQADAFTAVRQGKAAHICGAAPRSARSKSTMSNEECRSFENGIWLCDICARLVDDNRTEYPEATLRKWKADAEVYVAELSTQDTRLRQLRGLVAQTLSALRILGALPGPGPRVDQTYHDAGSIPFARRLIESEQLLFENGFVEEAEKVRAMWNELVSWVQMAIFQNPENTYLDISEWKNKQVEVLMVEVMRFSNESYRRYLDREMSMVKDARTRVSRLGAKIHSLTEFETGRMI
jgi:hypothetical protein